MSSAASQRGAARFCVKLEFIALPRLPLTRELAAKLTEGEKI